MREVRRRGVRLEACGLHLMREAVDPCARSERGCWHVYLYKLATCELNQMNNYLLVTFVAYRDSYSSSESDSYSLSGS